MKRLALSAYLIVEISVFVAMVVWLGFGWAVLISLGAALLGFVMLRSQGRKVFEDLRRAGRNEVDPGAPLTDSAVLAGATLLMVIPGVVSTVIGIVALFGPVRRALRPAVTALGLARMTTLMERGSLMTMNVTGSSATGSSRPDWGGQGWGGQGWGGPTVVDGDVVDPEGPDGWSGASRSGSDRAGRARSGRSGQACADSVPQALPRPESDAG